MYEAPPEFGPEFLEWLRMVSEDAWRRTEEWSLTDFAAAGLIGAVWRPGTQWTGALDDPTIADIERRYDLHFPVQQRLFLQTLHSTTPWQHGADYSGDGVHFGEHDRPGFYDWLHEEERIRAAMGNVVTGLVSETRAGQFWHPSWGPCPDRFEDRTERMTELVAAAPTLIPIFGHRFVVADNYELVLSVHGTDIIVYGTDLRDYLLNELRDVLPDAGYTHKSLDDPPRVPFWENFLWPDYPEPQPWPG